MGLVGGVGCGFGMGGAGMRQVGGIGGSREVWCGLEGGSVHLSGTTDAKLPDDWMAVNGQDATASEDEMKQHVAHANLSDLKHDF